MHPEATFGVIDTDASLWIDNGLVGLDFLRGEVGQLSLRSVLNRVTGEQFHLQERESDPWWELEWRDRKGYRAVISSATPAKAKHHIEYSDTGNELLLITEARGISLQEARRGHGVSSEGTDGDRVDVQVEVRLRLGEPFAYINSTMQHWGKEYTLWRWTLPLATNLRRSGANRAGDHLTLPNGWGHYVAEPAKQPKGRSSYPGRGGYPSHSWTMQFLAFDNENHGIYLGIHDPQATPKFFNVNAYPPHRWYPDPPSGESLFVSVDHLPEGMGSAQPESHVNNIVLGVFQGNWYDAAQIYRRWASLQEWTSKGNVAQRRDIPEWFRETGMWWCLSSGRDTGTLTTAHEVSPKEVGDLAMELCERFPHPTSLHWYNWHHAPFNTEFPDYFPARPGFADQVKRLAKESVRVMPYINARLADPNSDSWLCDGMEPFSAKWISPRCEPHSYYQPTEQYPGEQWLVPMCAATTYWRDKICTLVQQMKEELGIDAVYLDQIAAGMPPVCFDSSHGHPEGGGEYAVRGYQELLGRILAANEERSTALTTECNAEPYIPGVSGFLMWMSIDRHLVPMFPVVYGGLVVTFGRRYTDDDLEDANAFFMKTGQMFTWGCQLGWIANSVAKKLLTSQYREHADYLNRVVTAYLAGRHYLQEGRLLRTPTPITPLEMLTANWSRPLQKIPGVELPEVLCELWLSPEGKVAMAITNMSEFSRTVRYLVDEPQLRHMKGRSAASALSPDCLMRSSIAKRDDGLIVEVSLSPRSAAVLEIGEA